MIISKNHYKKLVSDNKKLKHEVEEMEDQIKYLRVTNDEYYKGAVKWKHMYDKMRELFDNREIKSPIVEQRDAEIEALKHMIERLDVEQEKIRKDNDKLVKELSACQQKLNYLRDIFKANVEIAELYHNEDKMRMWQAFLKEV